MLKKILVFILMFFILTATVCYAEPVKVTEENLKEAFERLASTENSDIENAEISVENNVIKLTAEDETISFNYDLTGKPTFSTEVLIKEGMSVEEFSEETGKLVSAAMLGYGAVADIQGVKIQDSGFYILTSLLFNSKDSNSDALISFSSEDLNKEFDVMEYVNKEYKEKQIVSDANELNSYTYTTEMKDVTETSCKLVSTLSVNLDANFSELNGYAEKTLGIDVTEESADYKLTLKVGQKCKIQTDEEITGYRNAGTSIEFDMESAEMTAKSVGVTKGYIEIGNTKKTFYVTVEGNTGNTTLEPITLVIDKIIDDTTNNSNNNVISNNIADLDKLPETGEEKSIILNALYTMIGVCCVCLVTILFATMIKKK